MLKEKIAEILEELIDIRNSKKLEIEDYILLQEAIRLFISANIQAQKTNKPSSSGEMASTKQLQFLKQLGYKGTMDLTKSEASALIQEYKGEEI
jgi:hypothetical protein